MLNTLQEVTIHVFVGSEGGLIYDIWYDNDPISIAEKNLLDDDGGECTSGISLPHQVEDWKNAIEMAMDQVLNEVKSKLNQKNG
jgi:hypothetical protein